MRSVNSRYLDLAFRINDDLRQSEPLIREAMEAGWQGDFPGGNPSLAPLASNFFNYRKTTIYGGSNEVQRNIVAQTVLG